MPTKNSTPFLQKSINITELVWETLKRWYIIVATVVLAVVIALIYTLCFVTPLYTSTAKIFVLSRQTEGYFTSTDFNISTYISNDFSEIVKDTPILKLTAKDLENKYSTDYLKSVVGVEKLENTRIILIRATTPDAIDSKKIVDSICKNAKEQLVEIMKLDSVEIIKEGDIPTEPSSPVLTTNIIFAVIIALLLAEFAVVINYSLNNKLSSSEDIQNCLELSVLATIPFNETKNKK